MPISARSQFKLMYSNKHQCHLFLKANTYNHPTLYHFSVSHLVIKLSFEGFYQEILHTFPFAPIFRLLSLNIVFFASTMMEMDDFCFTTGSMLVAIYWRYYTDK